MSSETNPSDDGTTDAQIDYEELEALVETVEDRIEVAEDHLDDYERTDPLEDQKEAIEDLVDEARDNDEPDRLEGAEELASTLRTQVNDLQDDVGYDDGDTAEALDDLEDAAYNLEEAVEDLDTAWDPFVVITKRYEVSSRVMTPKEILQEVEGHDPANEVLYWKHGESVGDDDFIPANKEIDLLLDGRVFTAYNHENPYGQEVTT